MTSHDENGFTLIELVIATMLLGIVVSTISVALVLYLTSTEETADRLAESPQAQITSVYLTRDAQSGELANDASRCASSTWTSPTTTHLASFGWRDPGATTAITDDTAVIVSYVVATGTQKELRRYECTDADVFETPGAAFPSTIGTASETQTLISYIDPGTPAPSAVVTASTVTVSLRICTADDAVTACKHGSSLPFSLAVSRRVT